jgi:RNA polymerase sigma factor (sigma-70 family)
LEEQDWLAERFEENRNHLRAVAYRMLGSMSEADDAVQDAWLRFSRSDPSGVRNLGGWLTTMVACSCLDILRSRRSRREEPLEAHRPEPIGSHADATDPEHEALLADSVGLALQVVLDTLAPAERLAFVLHDIFAVPFDQIAPIVDRSPAAARQLASRARRRVQRAATAPDADLTRQREIVDAFFAAASGGDFDALLAVLDPDIVVRADSAALPAGGPTKLRGTAAVARQALAFARWRGRSIRPALVNGAAGVVVVERGRPFAVMDFTVRDRRIVEIDVVADPERLRRLDLVTPRTGRGPSTNSAPPNDALGRRSNGPD